MAVWGGLEEGFAGGTRAECQLWAWLAAKRSGRWDSIKDEVRAFDTSALHPRFAVAKAALCDDLDECLKILRLTRGADLWELDWDESPLLEELRCDSRFDRFRARRRAKRRRTDRTGDAL